MSLMDAMTGLSLDSTWISRHMRSEASASPPGESTRRTTALMFYARRQPEGKRWVKAEARADSVGHVTGFETWAKRTKISTDEAVRPGRCSIAFICADVSD